MLELSEINIFNIVFQSGSFSAAASKLFMTPPAVMNRINNLEKSLGVSLFKRTAQGVSLTDSGKILYENAPQLIQANNELVNLVRQSALKTQYIVRVGSSTINPVSNLSNLWSKISDKLPQYHLQFIPLENNRFKFPETYYHMGDQVDLLFSPYGMDSVRKNINFYEMGKFNFTIMMHTNDPLAKKSKIELSDLNHANFYIMPSGMSKEIDKIYKDIDKQKLKINMIITDAHYTVNTFNKFSTRTGYLLSLNCWDNVLPGLISRPLNVPFQLPYGFITAKNPERHIKLFIEILQAEI